MIPRTIQIQNFLSYGQLQTINFHPYHLICLSGKNGHGKSALLDAITWAIWGQARKVASTTRPEQGLLRLGKSVMMVILDFEVNSTLYRVKRLFELVYGQPKLSIEFGIYRDADTYIPLTEKATRATQDIIEKTIGLTFDTFVHSAFLRQGNANEFSKKSPKERKEIISSMLGLDTYEHIRKAALEKIKQTSTDKNIIGALQAHRLALLDEQGDLDIKQKNAADSLAIMQAEHTHAQQQLDHMQQELMRIKQELHTKAEHAQNLAQMKLTLQTIYTQLHEARTIWKTAHVLCLHIPDTTVYEQKKKELSALIDTFQQAKYMQLCIKEQLLRVQQQMQELQYQIEQTIQAYTQQIKLRGQQLSHEYTQIQTQRDHIHQEKKSLIAKLQTSSTAIEHMRIDIKKLSLSLVSLAFALSQFEKRKGAYQRWTSLGTIWHNQYTALQQKNLWQHDSSAQSCPACQQNVSAARKKFLHAKYGKERAEIQYRIHRLKQILPSLKEILVADHAHISTLRKQETEQITMQHMLEKEVSIQQDLHATLTHMENQDTILKTKDAYIQEEIQKNNHTLSTYNPAESLKAEYARMHILKQEVAQYTAQLDACMYNAQAHEKAIEELKKMQEDAPADTQKKAFKIRDQKKQDIYLLCKHIKELRTRISALAQVTDNQDTLKEQQNSLLAMHSALQTKIAQLTKDKEQIIHTIGTLSAKQASIKQTAQEYVQTQDKLTAYDQLISDYTHIVHATNKDGIQALLIEEALPEIEQEANILLSKLTHNNAHIMIESLRDLKKGGTKETLDIKISDAAGIRPYELFSGGEAFRIDFALRLAMSKLLTRRAGTSVQTLIIDEGFGSQDEEGLSLIMDALYAIQDDFAKIIIVSHLPHMKDQFPVHFHVEKNASTSSVTVIEHG